MRTVAMLSLILLLNGCSGLLLRDDDTAAQTTGKVAARVLFGVASLGTSEAAMSIIAKQEQRDAEFAAWWRQASPQERAAYQQRQAEMAAALAPYVLGSMNWGRVPPAPAPTFQPAPFRSPITCRSYALGNTIRTVCD